MHEVVFTEATRRALEAAAAAGRPTWRVSSTLFAHCASDFALRPLLAGAGAGAEGAYPPTLAGEYVRKELEVINLGKKQAAAAAPAAGAAAGGGVSGAASLAS